MKINIGCGKQTWKDYYCVDAVRHPQASRAPDLLHAFVFHGEQLANRLPLSDGCAEEVFSGHFIEHVYRWESPAMIREFHRLLIPGGKLVLELPNIEAAARNLLAGSRDQLSMWAFYGSPDTKDPYMTHRWGYSPRSIKSLLESNGFAYVVVKPPQTHGARVNRDMRVEAIKS